MHLLLALLLALAAGTAVATPSAPPARRGLTIRLPEGVPTEQVRLIVGVYGHGLGAGAHDTKQGVRDYPVSLDARATRVKLLAYLPGYRMVTAEVGVSGAGARILELPQFRKLPTVPVTLRVVDGQDKPVPGQQLSFGLSLETHRYFGYSDGMASGATVLTATTAANGEAQIEMPLVMEDPYFAKGGAETFGLSVSPADRWRGHARGEVDLQPSRFAVRRSYPGPVVFTLVRRAHLTGRIEPSFFRRNRVQGDVTPYLDAKRTSPFRVEMSAERQDTHDGWNCMLMPGGKFSVVLSPGQYRLRLIVLGKRGRLERELIVAENVALSEGETRVLNVK